MWVQVCVFIGCASVLSLLGLKMADVCISQEFVCKVGSSPLLLRSIVYMDI